MWLARGLGWLSLICATGFLLGSEPRASFEMAGVITRQNLAYEAGGSSRQRLDLYLPAGQPPEGGWPVVLALHGGGWRGGDKGDYGRSVARIAQHGVAVAAADYELSRPGNPSWPANLEDVRQAVRWLRSEGGKFDLSPDKIAALGSSAGGHLAAMLGAASNDPASRVDAVVSFYGPMRLSTLSPPCLTPGGPVDLLLGGTGQSTKRREIAASPLNHVSPDDAPMLLVHGLDDALIPPEQSREMALALEAAGVPHRLIEVSEAGHAFGFVVNGHDLLPDILEFLSDTWKDNKVEQ